MKKFLDTSLRLPSQPTSVELKKSKKISAVKKVSVKKFGANIRRTSVDPAKFTAIKAVEPELRFWLQTSGVRVESGDAKVQASASGHGKCDRCWHYREDVGQHAGHETICGRCVSNIAGPGETRRGF